MTVKVAVLGAGLMGRAVAALCARHGHRVAATASPRQNIDQVHRDITGTLEDGVANSVMVTQDLELAVAGADVVIECLPEEIELKVEHLQFAQRVNGSCLLATNTSSFRISDLAETLDHPGRFLGLHFLNPPSLLPIVEVVVGRSTEGDALDAAVGFVEQIGCRPAVVRDAVGFVINRLQFALIREAVALAEAGVAAPSTIDDIVREGLGRRWASAGPFETASLGGVYLFDVLARRILPHLDRNTRLPASLDQFVGSVDVRRSSQRRDHLLRGFADVVRNYEIEEEAP